MPKDRLNIVDDNDNISGIEDRTTIHEKGLLHREVHVYFITPNHEIIFQHRAKDKDTFPDLLDATVGGHVEIGDSYEETAVKETLEETGVLVKISDLILVKKIRNIIKDEVTDRVNNAFKEEYVYLYNGKIENLKIETGKAIGFEAWPIDRLLSLNDAEKTKFIPNIHNFAITTLLNFIKNKKI